jgi:hypothetical protein
LAVDHDRFLFDGVAVTSQWLQDRQRYRFFKGVDEVTDLVDLGNFRIQGFTAQALHEEAIAFGNDRDDLLCFQLAGHDITDGIVDLVEHHRYRNTDLMKIHPFDQVS